MESQPDTGHAETELTLDFFLVAQVLQQGCSSVQHRLVLHPVVVKEEERLLTLLLQRERGAIAPGLVHLQQVRAGAQPAAAASAHLHPLNSGCQPGENAPLRGSAVNMAHAMVLISGRRVRERTGSLC